MTSDRLYPVHPASSQYVKLTRKYYITTSVYNRCSRHTGKCVAIKINNLSINIDESWIAGTNVLKLSLQSVVRRKTSIGMFYLSLVLLNDIQEVRMVENVGHRRKGFMTSPVT